MKYVVTIRFEYDHGEDVRDWFTDEEFPTGRVLSEGDAIECAVQELKEMDYQATKFDVKTIK